MSNFNDSFPIEFVPQKIREAITSIQNMTKAPTALIASSVFSCISLAAQSGYDIERNKNLTSPISLNFLVIAKSGERKTTVDNIAFKPIYDFQDEESTEFSQFIYSDITPFALLERLHKSSRSAALIENEAGRIFEGKLIKDIGLFNLLYDGKSQTIYRHNKCLSIISPRCTNSLMIQPLVFRDAIRKSQGRLIDYGFFARCLICEPASAQGSRFIVGNETIDNSSYDFFYSRIKEIIMEQREYFSPGSEKLKTPRKILKFDESAQTAWVEIFNYIEENSAHNGVYEEHSAYASKMAENIARLAGIFHVFERNSSDRISVQTLQSAIEIVIWYTEEYIFLFSEDRLYDQIEDDAIKLQQFLNKIFQKNGTLQYRKSDLLQYGPSSLRKAARLDAAIDILHRRGVVYITQNHKTNSTQRTSRTAYICLNTASLGPSHLTSNFLKNSLIPPTRTFNR